MRKTTLMSSALCFANFCSLMYWYPSFNMNCHMYSLIFPYFAMTVFCFKAGKRSLCSQIVFLLLTSVLLKFFYFHRMPVNLPNIRIFLFNQHSQIRNRSQASAVTLVFSPTILARMMCAEEMPFWWVGRRGDQQVGCRGRRWSEFQLWSAAENMCAERAVTGCVPWPPGFDVEISRQEYIWRCGINAWVESGKQRRQRENRGGSGARQHCPALTSHRLRPGLRTDCDLGPTSVLRDLCWLAQELGDHLQSQIGLRAAWPGTSLQEAQGSRETVSETWNWNI